METEESGAQFSLVEQPIKHPGKLRPLPPPGTMQKLTGRHMIYIDRMVFGLPRPLQAFPDLEPGIPLSENDVAMAFGLRRNHIRRLMREPVAIAYRNKLLQQLRTGEHAKSIHTMKIVRDDLGDNAAADRKIRLDAAAKLLGEEAKGVSVTVNNQIGVGVSIKAGYVIREPARRSPETIEGKATNALEIER